MPESTGCSARHCTVMSEWEPTRPQRDQPLEPTEPSEPDLPTGEVPQQPTGGEPYILGDEGEATVAMPGAGDLPPGAPPAPPGGPGGPGGPFEPFEPFEEEPWYRRRGPLAAAIGVGLALLFLLIAFLIWLFSDDDDDSLATIDNTSTTIETTTTVPESTTTVEQTTTSTADTSTSTSTTTTTTTTVAPTTTEATTTTSPPTTLPPATTTTAPPTTTTVPPTTTIPVVTVPPQAGATIWDVIRNSPDLSGIRTWIERAGVQDDVDDPDTDITFLAPSNTAIENAEGGIGAPDFDDPDVVGPYVLTLLHQADAYRAPAIFDLDELTVVDGGPHPVDKPAQTIGGAKLILTNVEAANGMLHVTDLVLTP